MNDSYDISKSFQRIEERLIKSLKVNLMKHLNEEKLEDMRWTAWQTEQLKSLELFKKNNKDLFKKDFFGINSEIKQFLTKNFEDARISQENFILKSIDDGTFNSQNKKINKLWNIYSRTKNKRIKKKQLKRIFNETGNLESSFFKVDQRKLKQLIRETTKDMQRAEMSILRYTNDQYRKIIFDSQVYANTGAGTVQQAVDMATKDFLSRGIASITYANGACVNIASYAEMAVRTANLRAHLYGEGEKRKEWGIHTVLVPNRGGGCPYCIKYQGKVFIDDVYSNGTLKESEELHYPLLSTAIKGRLFHPNCKDTVVTYFPGINTEVSPPTRDELAEKVENYKKEQKLNYIDRQINKYKRLEIGCIDKDNIEKYHQKRLEWHEYKRRFKENGNIAFNGEVTKPKKDVIILTDIEKDQLTEYTRFDATRINSAIRLDRVNDKIQSKIDIIDGAISKSLPVQEDMILHRGTIIQSFSGFEKFNKVPHNEIMDLKDSIISDRAFISTSREKAEEQGRNIIMNINVPKGFKGALDIEDYATPKYKYQKEVLLKRNTKFYVKNIEYNQENKKYYFDVEVLNEKRSK